MHRTFIKTAGKIVTRTLYELEKPQTECRCIAGSFLKDLQLLVSHTYLIPAKRGHEKTRWKLKQQISVLKKNWGEKDAVRITTTILSFVPKLASMLLPLATKLL